MLNKLRLILVSPKYSGNVGACARVATNFAISDFYVVDPQCDIFDQEAQLYGKGPARETLSQIKKCVTLSDGLKDCSLAIAFTRRHGDWSPVQIPLKGLSDFVHKSFQGYAKKIALVFGREDNCLLRDEQMLCSHVCSIPTSATMPTMNLSHSVAVVLSQLFMDISGENTIHSNNKGEELASLGDFEEMIFHFEQTMIEAGMTKGGNPERVLGRIQRILQRTELRQRDVAVLRGFLGKVQVAIKRRNLK